MRMCGVLPIVCRMSWPAQAPLALMIMNTQASFFFYTIVRCTPAPERHLPARAACAKPTDYTPIWLMRQAGRYLPEYRATRARAGSFMGLATNPDFATEVTLQPVDRYALDAAILFSDILTVPDAMGLGLHFVEAKARSSSARCATKRRCWRCANRIWHRCNTCSTRSRRSAPNSMAGCR